MKLRDYMRKCATLGPLGFLPAPGTMATGAMMPVVWFVRGTIANEWSYLFFTFILSVAIFICIYHTRDTFPGSRDPSAIILDECLGTFITFVAVPVTFGWFILGFCLFRFFDIFKIFGVSACEKIKGAAGIMLDDVLAAVWANVVLHLFILYFKAY